MPRRPRRDLAKEWYWRRLLRQWRRSGLTGRAFCLAEQLSVPSFYAWKRVIAGRDQGQRKTAAKRAAARKAQPVAASERANSWAARRSAAPSPGFVKLAFAGGETMPSPIEVVVAQGRLLRVRPGFDENLLRQLLRVLEEPSC